MLDKKLNLQKETAVIAETIISLVIVINVLPMEISISNKERDKNLKLPTSLYLVVADCQVHKCDLERCFLLKSGCYRRCKISEKLTQQQVSLNRVDAIKKVNFIIKKSTTISQQERETLFKTKI